MEERENNNNALESSTMRVVMQKSDCSCSPCLREKEGTS